MTPGLENGQFVRNFNDAEAFPAGRSLTMHACAHCGNPLQTLTEWRADDGQFYCNEFCADGGNTRHEPLVAVVSETISEQDLRIL